MTTIHLPIKVKVWKEKATGNWLMYSKKFNIASYGKTKKEARKMFMNIINDDLEFNNKNL